MGCGTRGLLRRSRKGRLLGDMRLSVNKLVLGCVGKRALWIGI